jgi:hypothetical protein
MSTIFIRILTYWRVYLKKYYVPQIHVYINLPTIHILSRNNLARRWRHYNVQTRSFWPKNECTTQLIVVKIYRIKDCSVSIISTAQFVCGRVKKPSVVIRFSKHYPIYLWNEIRIMLTRIEHEGRNPYVSRTSVIRLTTQSQETVDSCYIIAFRISESRPSHNWRSVT